MAVSQTRVSHPRTCVYCISYIEGRMNVAGCTNKESPAWQEGGSQTSHSAKILDSRIFDGCPLWVHFTEKEIKV